MKTLHFVENATEQVVLGKLSEFLVSAKKFAATKENIESDKRIVFSLTTKDDQVAKIICSPRVSNAIRAKEITQSQLGSLNVTEATSQSGEVINVLTMTGTEVAFDLNKIKANPVAKKEVALSELIAF